MSNSKPIICKPRNSGPQSLMAGLTFLKDTFLHLKCVWFILHCIASVMTLWNRNIEGKKRWKYTVLVTTQLPCPIQNQMSRRDLLVGIVTAPAWNSVARAIVKAVGMAELNHVYNVNLPSNHYHQFPCHTSLQLLYPVMGKCCRIHLFSLHISEEYPSSPVAELRK